MDTSLARARKAARSTSVIKKFYREVGRLGRCLRFSMFGVPT